MKDIRLIKSTQIMIFPADDIDYHSLSRDYAFQQISTSFSLQRISIPDQFPIISPQIILQNGEFTHKEKTYIIEQIVIDDRKIIFKILSSTQIADIFFSEFKKILLSLDLREEKGNYEPFIKTYETACILKLNFKLAQIMKEFDYKKIENIISKKHSHGAKINLFPSSIKFSINFSDIPEKLQKNKITISDKNMILEIREKTDPDEQIYYTVSPTDSETHLELLNMIEEMFEKQ